MTGFNLAQVAAQFCLKGTLTDAHPYGEGHINNTFLLTTDKAKYIFQRVNHQVFQHPDQVMNNIVLVTEYLKNKLTALGRDISRETLNLVPTKDRQWYYVSENGDYFRIYHFIDGATTYQLVENPEHFYNAARAFGEFQNLLADFPADQLYETIPNFHNTPVRCQNLQNAIAADSHGRAATAQKEIDFALARMNSAGVLTSAIESGELPLRVTHNDTKFNNVMIDDATGRGICVIDLDTVMPGSSLYDFGDSIRFGASTAEEDEQNLDLVSMDLGLFEQYTKGYLEALGDSITAGELKHMAESARIMTFECGIRFLTDFLEGDHYFRIHRENHNLDRCRTQLKLVADMEEKMERMNRIVAQYAR